MDSKGNVETPVKQKKINSIVKSVHSIINDLEKSLKKSSNYEKKLIDKCVVSRKGDCLMINQETQHVDAKLIYNEDGSPCLDLKCRTKSQASMTDETLSTMSYVCLQYQYEDLTDKYQKLLEDYELRCKCIDEKSDVINELQSVYKLALDELNSANCTVQNVCAKYLTLKSKRKKEQAKSAEAVARLARELGELQEQLARSRDQLDALLKDRLSKEQDTLRSQLLAEVINLVRRSNYLFRRNLQLKQRVQELETSKQ